MLKRSMFLLCLAVLLALGACGAPAAKSGLLTEQEISRLESLYFLDDDTVFSSLGISDDDIDRDSEDSDFLLGTGAYPLKTTRNIAGKDFQVIVTTSTSEPKGLYGIWLRLPVANKEEAREVLTAIHDEAVKLYGETDDPNGINSSSFLDQIAYGPPETGLLCTVSVGEISFIQLGCPILDNGQYSIALQYRIENMGPTGPLTPEEILEKAMSVQQK